MPIIEWAKEVNSILLEFEGQLSLSDIHNLTRKEIYYLRRFRQHYHIKQKEEAEKAAEAAKSAQEHANSNRRTNVMRQRQAQIKQRQAHNQTRSANRSRQPKNKH